MLMQLWRLEHERDRINLGNLCLRLSIEMSPFLSDESYTEVVCVIVCYNLHAVKRDQ